MSQFLSNSLICYFYISVTKFYISIFSSIAWNNVYTLLQQKIWCSFLRYHWKQNFRISNLINFLLVGRLPIFFQMHCTSISCHLLKHFRQTWQNIHFTCLWCQKRIDSTFYRQTDQRDSCHVTRNKSILKNKLPCNINTF